MSSRKISMGPKRAKLRWPGLKAKDHLSRVVTKWVKERYEEKEDEDWALGQVARLLDCVPPETVMKLLYREARRRGNCIPKAPIFVESRVVAGYIRIGMTT